MANSSKSPSLPRLLCIPGAGASAGRFERLRPALNDLVEVRTFELPGRGIRFAESSFTRLTDHFSHFIDRIEAEPYQQWIVLGESLGALTATWLAGELEDSARAEIIGVVTVAAAPGATGRRPPEEVIDDLRADAAQSPQAERMPMAASTIIDDIKAAHASADQVRLLPLDVPMATIRGADDRLISEEAARKWERLAPTGWRYEEVPGTHYQFEAPTHEFLTALRQGLEFVAPSRTMTAAPAGV